MRWQKSLFFKLELEKKGAKEGVEGERGEVKRKEYTAGDSCLARTSDARLEDPREASLSLTMMKMKDRNRG